MTPPKLDALLLFLLPMQKVNELVGDRDRDGTVTVTIAVLKVVEGSVVSQRPVVLVRVILLVTLAIMAGKECFIVVVLVLCLLLVGDATATVCWFDYTTSKKDQRSDSEVDCVFFLW